MASYHFSAQIIGKAKGRSAIAAAAYRAAAHLRDEQSGAEHDFTRRRGVVHTEILIPDGAASWLADRQKLWNHVHQLETRRDAQLCREINVALPHELSADERRALVRGFAREQFTARGMVADLAIHAPTDNDPRNHHAHIMLTLRQATPDGLYRVKTREWNSDAMLNAWRTAWADCQNRALERAQHPARVDHRTLAAQREAARGRGDRLAVAVLDRAPEIHVGPRAQSAARRGARPTSQPRTATTARPQGGTWCSSAATEKRQRTVDYAQIDRDNRAAFNARRSAAAAEATARRVARLMNRTARLRLIEVRYAQAIRTAEDGLRAVQRDRQRPPWQRPDAAQLASREAYFRARRSHTVKRSQLLRQLLGRADGILSGLFLVQERAFTRSRTLDERLLPRLIGIERGHLRPGRSREIFSPAGS